MKEFDEPNKCQCGFSKDLRDSVLSQLSRVQLRQDVDPGRAPKKQFTVLTLSSSGSPRLLSASHGSYFL